MKSARIQKAEDEENSTGINKISDNINFSSDEDVCGEEYGDDSEIEIDLLQTTKPKTSMEEMLAMDLGDIRSLIDEKRTEIEAEFSGISHINHQSI